MRRIGVDFAIWFIAALVLWLGGGLGLRPSVVVSLIFALIFDQIIEIEKHLSEPKMGVRHLGFDADMRSILLDLGVIDESTDWQEIDALNEAPYAAYPRFRTACVWIPEANLLVWPSIQSYQSKLNLNVTIRLPSKCPLAESLQRDLSSRYVEERNREVEFFIEDGYPDYEFGLWIPKAFAEERIKAGGFGDACTEYEEKELYGQYRLVVGRFPAILFRPHFPEGEPFGQYIKHLRDLSEFNKFLKDRFENLGWTLEDHEDNEWLSRDHEIAKHKYMQIEIFNRER